MNPVTLFACPFLCTSNLVFQINAVDLVDNSQPQQQLACVCASIHQYSTRGGWGDGGQRLAMCCVLVHSQAHLTKGAWNLELGVNLLHTPGWEEEFSAAFSQTTLAHLEIEG
jgi:hypothetical protein